MSDVGAQDSAQHPAGTATDVLAAFEDIPAVLWAFEGPEHRVIAANRAARASMGFRPGIVGRPIRDVAPELEGQQVFETLDEVWERGQPVLGDERRILVDRDGDGRLEEDWYSYTFVPTHHPDGSMRGMTVLITRVTDEVLRRRRAERSAAESEERRQAAQEVVLTLQRSLLPSGVPVLPRARLAARYVVAGRELAAGGDWFDALPLPDGRVVVAVGDVVGHGAAASTAMGRLRAVGANALASGRDVASTLAELDRFAGRERATRAATVCVAALDPRTGEVQVGAAGHPPPLVVTAAGTARWIDVPASGPLGTGAAGPAIATNRLGDGDVLVLYTDGLVERPGRALDAGLEALARTAVDAAHEDVEEEATVPTAQVDRIAALTVERMAWTGGGLTDDVTLLALQRTSEPPAAFALQFPPDPPRLRHLRRELAAWLNDVGASEDDVQTLVHAVGEAVTNAVEHAYPDPPDADACVRVKAELDDQGQVRVSVADTGRWRPATDDPGHRGRGLMMMRGLVEEVDVDTGPGGTTVTLAAPMHRDVLVGAYQDKPAVTSVRNNDDELVTELRGTDVLAAIGAIDTDTVERFRRGVLKAARGGARDLTLDVEGVSVFSSSAVQTVHELRRELPGLRLRAGRRSIARRVLALTGLDQLLDEVPDDAAPV
jgi:serine phosphatase RsbU (regulator of sigma subunit)/anti-sigma regulatory factor (Ser/Thr protein kinase)/anti-anti-sigma regulatory factor